MKVFKSGAPKTEALRSSALALFLLSTFAKTALGNPLPHRSDRLPWHFHTGMGVVKDSTFDPDSGFSVDRYTSECTLHPSNLDCYERVYFFNREEILAFVEAAKNILSEQRLSHAITAGVAGTIAVTATRSALVSGPNFINLGIAGISAVVVVFEGRAIHKINKQIEAIDETLQEEERFAARCGHLHKNFLERMSALGVQIHFNDYGGSAIPAHGYLKEIELEMELYEQAIGLARQYNWSREMAYSEFFHNQCGQVPSLMPTPGDEFFASDWPYIPESSLTQAGVLANQMGFFLGEHAVEFSGFDSNDFDDDSERAGLELFIARWETTLKILEAEVPWITDHLASEFEKIIVKPRFEFFSSKPYSVVTNDDGKKYLFLNASWSIGRKKYFMSLRPYIEDRYGFIFRD